MGEDGKRLLLSFSCEGKLAMSSWINSYTKKKHWVDL